MERSYSKMAARLWRKTHLLEKEEAN
jgi:hypothetical protein